ncbi:amidohydrolase family protein [Rhodococcus koreensis]
MTNPLGERLLEAIPESGGIAGSDIRLTAAQHLDGNGISRAVVCHDVSRSIAALPDPRLCAEAVRVCNEWMLDEVLTLDERLSGTLLLPMHSPSAAVAEIRWAADDDRWAAVSMSANGLGHPFGHPIYHPIYEAAVEAGFPIVIDTAADAAMDVLTNPTGTRASTFTDIHVLQHQPISTHFVSLVGQGVFERWPDLRVFLVGAGVAWITPLLWRFDADFKAFRRDAPGLSLLPSEYFARNVRVGTYSLDRFDDPKKLRRYLEVTELLADTLCYASGYPSWDRDTPAEVERVLPPPWLSKVMNDNATELFRWPEHAPVGADTLN